MIAKELWPSAFFGGRHRQAQGPLHQRDGWCR